MMTSTGNIALIARLSYSLKQVQPRLARHRRVRVSRFESCEFALDALDAVPPVIDPWAQSGAEHVVTRDSGDDAYYIEASGWARIGALWSQPIGSARGHLQRRGRLQMRWLREHDTW